MALSAAKEAASSWHLACVARPFYQTGPQRERTARQRARLLDFWHSPLCVVV